MHPVPRRVVERHVAARGVDFGAPVMATADVKKVIDVNLTGVFLGMKQCVPSLHKAGGMLPGPAPQS